MADSLEDFARRRREEAGADPRPQEREAARRALVRANVRSSLLVQLGIGTVLTAVGLVAGAWATAIALGLVDGPRQALLPLAITAAVFVGFGAFLGWSSRGFRVHWDLSNTGTRARAIVISVRDGGTVARGRYGPVVVSTSRVRLAVQVEGGAPYETTALAVDQLHGTLRPGQALTVFIDPATPLRVFIDEP
ncbi:MAG: hypothetical protein JNJ54_07920 [Myxococcaceae bacterium]|nr:hypothetical protein [Myxococcaceae bacterium]